MMKQYREPEFKIIYCDINDIITASPANPDVSLAEKKGDNNVELPPFWWD